MTTNTDSVLAALVLIERLAALIAGLGTRVREAQASGRKLTRDDLAEQSAEVERAIAEARASLGPPS